MSKEWTKEQQIAIDARGKNILVSASAGSGKTAVLVERVINKVIKEKIDIDKILVVTFTNASASELKERLQSAINDALEKDPKNVFLNMQLRYINRASITTIHSFCLGILRENFDVLNLDPTFKICDETQSRIFKAKAITNILENRYLNDKLENDISLYNILELFSSSDEKLCEYMLKLHTYIQSFEYPLEWLKEKIEEYNINDNDIDLSNTKFGKIILDNVLGEISILIKKVQMYMEEISDDQDFKKYYELLENDIRYLELLKNSENWDTLYELVKDVKLDRAPKYIGNNIELKEQIINFRNSVIKEKLKDVKKEIYAKSNQILEDNKKAYIYLKYIYSFICDFDIEYKKIKDKNSMIDFSDIEHLALKLLLFKDNDGLYKKTEQAIHITEKFNEVYTDEYQDTSFVQESILNAVSKENNRFMVGDIKQSIYRFRQAMPEIFNQKYDSYLPYNKDNNKNGAKIILEKNFRSRKNVIESINYIFEKIMSKDCGDCQYSGDETLKFGAKLYEENKDIDYRTKINIIDVKDNQDETICSDESDEILEYIDELKNFEIESIYIAKEIKNIVENFKVYDKDQKIFKKATYKDIVILIRNMKDKGKILEDTLKNYFIPAYSDTSTSLFESDEIKLVTSFLRIIDNPLQDIHMVSIMYSIIGKFTLDQLLEIRKFNERQYVYYNLFSKKDELEKKEKLTNCQKELLQKIDNYISILEKFNKYKEVYSLSELIMKMYKETDIYYQFSLDSSATMKKANLDLMIEFALKFEGDKNSSLREYIKYIDNLKDKQDTSASTAKILGENEDVVRIMTIHKSKGLEFPIVILCDTARKYNLLDSSMILNMNHNIGIGINIVDNDYNVTYPSVIKHAIRETTIEDTKSEELRMLYVAMTRAKEKLIIFSTLKDYQKKLDEKLLIYKEDKIDPIIISKNKTYFENIMIALKDYDEGKNLFDIKVIEPKIDKDINKVEQKKFDISQKVLSEIKKFKSKNLNIDISSIKNNMEFEYKFKELTATQKRTSVSQIKKENTNFNLKEESVEFEEPECIKKSNNRYTSTKKGTLMHWLIENIDFVDVDNEQKLMSQILKLKQNNIISNEDEKNIDFDKLNIFLNSKICLEIRKSNKVFKETEFILKDDSITSSYIQGIIDLYYYNENGNIVLVDFKTDKISDEKEFLRLYELQLNIYKTALEKITNTKVEHVYIYSFYLGKEIEL